ncbi:MAG: energy-coupling factor ABC transporter ATP-binding protein [Conexivisphaerales archaeon]
MRGIISVDGVWFSYPNNVTALKDINLAFNEGSITALIGQNGSGKTTLAKLMNALLKPTKGRVVVDGVETTDKFPYEMAKIVGYSFQNPTHQLYSHTVEAELMAGPRNLGLSEEEAKSRAEEAIKLFNLQGLQQLRPSALSFPLKKLVCLASVYTMKPKVMVLDEPTTGQDHVGLQMIQNFITTIKSLGITVIIITHDMRLVAERAEQVVVMALGRVVKTGTPDEIFLDEQVMEAAALRPPQIMELSSRLDNDIPNHGGASRTVEEEVRKIKRILGDSMT